MLHLGSERWSNTAQTFGAAAGCPGLGQRAPARAGALNTQEPPPEPPQPRGSPQAAGAEPLAHGKHPPGVSGPGLPPHIANTWG